LSGIVGILQKDGAPVDRRLLEMLTQFLGFRGPNGREVRTFDALGFGHTMLRTTQESMTEQQPFGLDGRFWITADARIDCRKELRAEIQNTGRRLPRIMNDSELILNAYAAWGEACTQRLRGDFSFAIWDIRERKLFCARDHFGIKPFYYAEVGDTFIFSNTLNCVRLHPLVAAGLNATAILDFLLVGCNWDNATTTFRDVKRLPPGHSLTVCRSESRVQSFWELPLDGRIRYRNEADYVKHFQALLKEAVSDRIRTDRLGIFLSGGLDSSSLAATARHLASVSPVPAKLHAYTAVSKSLLRDSEAPFAQTIAEHLKIPIRFHHLVGSKPFAGWDRENACPEPVDDPFFPDTFDEFRMIASDCPVVFNGEGNDALMSFEMMPYARDLVHRRQWGELLSSAARFLRVRRFPVRGILARVQRLLGRGALVRAFPNWISPNLATASQVKQRWSELGNSAMIQAHPVAPLAYASLTLPSWTQFFETNDPGLTHFPVEVRYPFLDLRIVEFLLAIPPFPWFLEKALLRRTMAGQLPQEILTRPKTPLAEDPLVKHLQLPEAAAIDQTKWERDVEQFVDVAAVPKLAGESSPEKARAGIRPHCLNFWLQYLRPVRYNFVAEAVNG
jgi:asparagine synthase (glutamine-hydrolysing)